MLNILLTRMIDAYVRVHDLFHVQSVRGRESMDARRRQVEEETETRR